MTYNKIKFQYFNDFLNQVLRAGIMRSISRKNIFK
jgi:hypothetical protein